MTAQEVKHQRKSLRLNDYDFLNRVGETAKKKWLEIP